MFGNHLGEGCLHLLIFALVAGIMLIFIYLYYIHILVIYYFYTYFHIFAGLEIIKRGRAGLVGEARPASFSNQGCPTDYNSDYKPSHDDYCCTADYY